MRVAVDLAPVEETLLIPLWARAEEARRDDPLLLDARAGAIRDTLDYDFDRLQDARASQLGCCVRGRLVDEWVRGLLRANPGCVVVDLGCGLDARFERVDDGRARWFDLDLPGVISLRRRFFEDSPRRTMLAASVLDEAWMDRIPADGPVVFVTEGMLPYLDASAVRSLFERLARRFPGSALLFDAMSPLVLRHQDRHDAMRHFEARFTWSVDDIRETERWNVGLRIEETRRFHDLMADQRHRVPVTLRWLGALAGTLYPPFKRAYTLCRARLG